MNEPKPFGSLTGSLLARKGQARPAMRPQVSRSGSQDDLGWNDMGSSVTAPRRVVMRKPVPMPPVSDEAVSEATVPPVVGQRAAPGSKEKSAFTLRLDSKRHLQLRLASAYLHRSAQTVVTEALDRYLAEVEPDIAARRAAADAGA